MQILKLRLEEIKVPAHRQRVEVEGGLLGELMESIVEHGLLHPIVVRASGWPDREYTLVAGGRRLAAISNLGGLGQTYKSGTEVWSSEFIPCVSLGDLDALSAEEAELEENVRRVNLTWKEQARATARLSDLRQQRAAASGAELPTLSDLAKEVRGRAGDDATELTRRELILSPYLEAPHIKGAKNLDEAWKAHLREEEDKRRAELARTVGDTYGKHSHTLIKADCLSWIRESPANQFDVILTDPPYGIGADRFGDAGGRLQSQTHDYTDTKQGWEDLIGTLGAHWLRVSKPQAHLYLCCDIDGFHFAREWLRRVGWEVHRTPLINYKVDGSRVPWPTRGPQRKWEMILYAVKGGKNVTRIYSDVLETRGDENFGHGAQKPVALYTNLLRRSVSAGDAVLDCFGGTGTIIPACHELMCRATYIEQDEVCYGIALKRLEELK